MFIRAKLDFFLLFSLCADFIIYAEYMLINVLFLLMAPLSRSPPPTPSSATKFLIIATFFTFFLMRELAFCGFSKDLNLFLSLSRLVTSGEVWSGLIVKSQNSSPRGCYTLSTDCVPRPGCCMWLCTRKVVCALFINNTYFKGRFWLGAFHKLTCDDFITN